MTAFGIIFPKKLIQSKELNTIIIDQQIMAVVLLFCVNNNSLNKKSPRKTRA